MEFAWQYVIILTDYLIAESALFQMKYFNISHYVCFVKIIDGFIHTFRHTWISIDTI